MKKVIFVCNYFHLDLASHSGIAEALNKKISAYLLLLNNTQLGKHDELIPSEYERYEKLKVLDSKLKKIKHHTIKDKIFAIKTAIYNFHQVGKILKEIKPDVLVLGSDLGGLNVRFLLVNVDRKKTNTIINYLCDIPPAATDWKFDLANKLLCKIDSKITNFIRALIFKGDVVGSFDLKSHIFVTSSEIMFKLVSRGINRHRLSLYNSYDNLLTFKKSKTELFGIPCGSFVVVFYTECIQDIYGVEYAKKLYCDLSSLFKCYSDGGVYVIIKPHPLEPDYMVSFIKNKINGNKISFANGVNVNSLISVSNVNIAHYSRVLVSACMLNKCIISINLKLDASRTFLNDDEKSVLEVNSIDELDRELNMLINNAHSREANKNKVSKIANRFKVGSSEELLNMISGS